MPCPDAAGLYCFGVPAGPRQHVRDACWPRCALIYGGLETSPQHARRKCSPLPTSEAIPLKTPASNRAFGLLLVTIFWIVAAIQYWRDQDWLHWSIFGALMMAISLFIPRVLAPAKRLWLKLAALLSLIVTPVALGLIYAVAMIPVGVLMRLFGKDVLSLKNDPSAASYWIKRDIGNPAPESLRDQF
jgi:cytochrome c oxidase subunit IV